MRQAAVGALMAIGATASASGAWAQCVGNTGLGFTSADLVPFGKGTAIASIITTIGTVNNSSVAQSGAFTGSPGGAKPDQQGGGVWVREVGGTVETKARSSTTAGGTIDFFGFPLAVPNSTTNCEITNRTEFLGTQLGFDIARLNFGGSNLFLGVTAGHYQVESRDKTPGEGSFRSEFDVPFAGIYAGINRGPLQLDAQVRWDAYRGKLYDSLPITNTAADRGNQALFGQQLTANALTFLWNAAYRFDLPQNWFVEPSIGGVTSRAAIDTLDVSGNYVINSTNTLTPPGTVKIDHVDSLLGRASVRVGTTIVANGVAWQPLATASVFHEFAGDVRARMNGDYGQIGLPGLSTQGASQTTRVGTYGHVGLGLAGLVLDTGWLGYLRADYRFGENLEGLSFNAGVRYQFTPEKDTASLKDGPSEHHEAPKWAGLYAGLFGGALFSQTDWQEAAGNIGPRASGGILGGQIGYNFQHHHTVFGLEADWGASNADGSTGCPGTVTINGAQANRTHFFACHSAISQLALLTGRIGHTWDRLFLYAKGGVAIGDVDNRSKYNLNGAPLFFPGQPADTSGGQSQTMVGWALGAGVEFALTERWSAKGEYMHFDLGSEKFTVDNGVVVNANPRGDSVRIGINYHFGKKDD